MFPRLQLPLSLGLPFLIFMMVACRSSASTSSPPSSPPRDADAEASTTAPEAATTAAGATTDAATEAASSVTTTAAAPEGMLLVVGGTFKMGSDPSEGGEGDEHPAHEVTVASFFLDKTEVTQAAYEECVAANVCAAADAEILASFGGLFKGAQKPVVGITWFNARDYCGWKGGKRLPREAEYERAVRGDDGRKYPWGNEQPTKERTVFSPANAPEDVGTHPTGRGPYGHDDLAGNVWEWIEDDYDPFAYTRPSAREGKPGSCDEINAAQNKLRTEGRQGFTGTNPIPTECEKNIRGGAYNYPAFGLRSTNRIHHPPKFKLRMTGARCAKDVAVATSPSSTAP